MTLDQEYTKNSIRTYTGKAFDIKILDPESICIEDIAHALSYTPRFGGHLKGLYSVAQHSYYVCERIEDNGHGLAGLLHDASEAYLGDIPSPFKSLMPDYKELEHNLSVVIANKYGFTYPYHPSIKTADKEMLSLEWDIFVMDININNIEYWTPEYAKSKFLEKFNQLTKNKS